MCVHVVQWRQEKRELHLGSVEVRLLERVQRRLLNLDNNEDNKHSVQSVRCAAILCVWGRCVGALRAEICVLGFLAARVPIQGGS